MIYEIDSKSIKENNLLKDENSAFSLTEEEFEFFTFYFGYEFFKTHNDRHKRTFGANGIEFKYEEKGFRLKLRSMIYIDWNKYPNLAKEYEIEKLQMMYGRNSFKFLLQPVKDYFDLLSI